MSDWYKLIDRVPVKTTVHEGARLLQDAAARTVARQRWGDVEVSTVFLALDHNWGDGPPVLFETMVFGGPLDGEMDRYCTWDEAVEGHARMAARVKEGNADA